MLIVPRLFNENGQYGESCEKTRFPKMSLQDPKTRYCFLAEWFDLHAQIYRHYEFFFYPFDNSIEMYDTKQRKTFLRRTKTDIKLQELFVGASVNVNARQLHIRDFGDEFTRKALQTTMERLYGINVVHCWLLSLKDYLLLALSLIFYFRKSLDSADCD
jgi:hypothetical protein